MSDSEERKLVRWAKRITKTVEQYTISRLVESRMWVTTNGNETLEKTYVNSGHALMLAGACHLSKRLWMPVCKAIRCRTT